MPWRGEGPAAVASAAAGFLVDVADAAEQPVRPLEHAGLLAPGYASMGHWKDSERSRHGDGGWCGIREQMMGIRCGGCEMYIVEAGTAASGTVWVA